MMQGNDFTSEPGGIMEVVMWLCTVTSWALIQLMSSTQQCCVGSRQ